MCMKFDSTTRLFSRLEGIWKFVTFGETVKMYFVPIMGVLVLVKSNSR